LSWSRRLSVPLLIGALLVPAATTAEGELLDAWVASDDGLAFATNGDPGQVPGLTTVGPDRFPELVADLPGPDVAYQVDMVDPSGSTRVVGLHDADDLAGVDEGRTPLLAKVVFDDDGPHWLDRQHIVSTPAGCSAATEPEGCIHPSLTASTIDFVFPADGQPFDELRIPDALEPGFVATTGTTDRPGTLFNFAGGSTVGTGLEVLADGTIAITSNVEIGDGLGGRLRGFDAQVFEEPPDGSTFDLLDDAQWQEVVASLRSTDARQNGPNRRVLECPASGRGYVHSRFLVNGLGRNLASFGGETLEGGAQVIVSEIIPFECPPANGNSLLTDPAEGPAASLWCISMWPNHSRFSDRQDGVRTVYNSSLLELLGIITVGIPIDTDFRITSRVGGANSGDPFSIDFEGIELDSATHPDAVFWVGEAEVGIDDFGGKKLRRLDLSGEFGRIDLIDQRHELLGESFKVTASEKPVGNCPDFDSPFEIPPPIFADGFESGDTSSWSYTKP
jgi:hypothetical protein